MLIGRDPEIGRLTALLDESAPVATHRVVFIDGPIGIGKTALLSGYLAGSRPTRLLFARATESPAHIPLAGVGGIVEAALDEELPELLAAGSSMRSLRRRVREAIPEKAMIVVDDVQWLDQDSVDLLVELLSTPSGGDLRFVFVHRSSFAPGELSRAATRGGHAVCRISLAPLDDEQSVRLLERWGAVSPAILRLGGGNPLYLRLLAEGNPVADRADPMPLDVSAGLDDTLRVEIAALPFSARRVLHALSLVPPPPPSALSALTGLDENALLDASELLAARGLSDPLQLEILHPLIAAAAHRDMDSATRTRLHRIAADRMSSPVDRAAHLRHLGAHLSDAEVDALLEGAAMVIATAPRSALRLLQPSRRIPHRGRDLLLARALLLDGRPRQAEELLRALIGDDDSSKEATALLIQALRIQGRPDEAVELAREVSDWELHPEVAIEAATLMVMHEDTQDADLIEKAARSSSEPGVAAALSALTALAHLRHGDVPSARVHYAAARDGFSSIPASGLLPVIGAVTAAGWSAHMVGDFEGGASLVRRAIQLAERNGRVHALPHLYSILAFLCIPLDRPEEIQELVEKALDAAERYDWPDVIPLATTAALVAAPDRAATETWYRRVAQLELPRTWWWREVTALFRARVEIRLGIPADVSALAVDGSDVFGIQKHIGLGELALAHGDIRTARLHADGASALGARFGVPYLSGQAELFRAEVLRAIGSIGDARDAARRAALLFAEARAPLYARSAETWLRRLDSATPRVPAAPAPGESLTRRELDVAELAAEGLSNREIADRLHLSIRTVESHVSRILHKRGLRSRAGLARDLDAR
ncbi:LuxR C-terminal-related transcriptional regulator [Microbacterium sp. KUDC0406]|uniref:helix-turn-helix transcriptional regulator n=1 Tax=Microbacterium sp. KUDC0406 TaxID=2909588 RepID=UPI001F161ED8|nr:LuxR family transcriptional regulator [Microbacterium sp. KUDC0406]UJP11187.1 LuxR C-terminal-related transcriptional regulator [Microbacterium sp. KUDC0406]